MSVQKNISQSLKGIQLAANTPLSLTGLNYALEVWLYFPTGAANITVTERSITTPANDGLVPTERLVFNPSQVEAAQVVVDSANKRFTIAGTNTAFVGYYNSAYHDQIECNTACTVMLVGDKDWKEFA